MLVGTPVYSKSIPTVEVLYIQCGRKDCTKICDILPLGKHDLLFFFEEQQGRHALDSNPNGFDNAGLAADQ